MARRFSFLCWVHYRLAGLFTLEMKMNITQIRQELIEAWRDSQHHLDFKTPFARWIRHHRGMYAEGCALLLDWEMYQRMKGAIV